MFKPALALTAALVFSVSAQAAPVTYKVEPTHTYAHAQYNHLGFSTQSIRFNTVTGTVTLDREAKTGEVDIQVQADSLSSGSVDFDKHLNGKDHLDTTAHPIATFKSNKINFDGDKPVSAEGELSIKGITKPVTLEINALDIKPHPMVRKETLGADGVIKIKRSDFDAGKNAPAVSDETQIIVAIEAIAQ